MIARVLSALILVAGLCLTNSELAGQAGPAGEYTRIVSINPLTILILEFVSVDFEATLGDNTSLGASISRIEWRDDVYHSLDGKARYYLRGRALDGLAVAALAGFNLVSIDDENETRSAIGLGLSVENQWLVGQDERLALALGVGGKRLVFLSGRRGASQALPYVRVSLGWAF